VGLRPPRSLDCQAPPTGSAGRTSRSSPEEDRDLMAVESADTVVPVVDASSDRLLTHYFRYVMREESGPLRDRLQRGLVERALKTGNQEHTMTAANIQANVEKLTGVKSYPRELVNQALHQL